MIQAHIFYSGMVQGVGFRYTVERHANALDLKGWVRNLADGRVEVLVEGPKEKVEELCKNIEAHFQGYIRDKEIGFSAAAQTFKKFQIVA